MWLLLVLLSTTILGLRSRGICTERVVAHPITLFPFSPGFCYDRWKSSCFRELECTPTWKRVMCAI